MKRSRIRPQSPRRASERSEREKVVRAALDRDRGCIAKPLLPGVKCWGPLDGHEVKTRGRGGSHLDLDNVVTLCRRHHDWVGENPKRAHELGLLKHGWE